MSIIAAADIVDEVAKKKGLPLLPLEYILAALERIQLRQEVVSRNRDGTLSPETIYNLAWNIREER